MYFVNRRKLIFIHREKRILLVAFSRKTVTSPEDRTSILVGCSLYREGEIVSASLL